jgi:hypothetical protein
LVSLPRLPEPHLFWIDAICIDQNNDDEKSSQVALMGEIYTSAYQVVVWLGKTDRGSDRAIRMIPLLLPLMESFEESNQLHILGFDTEFRSDGDFDLPISSFELLNRVMWNDVFGLFHRSWFEQLWVVQGVILAKNITILCGSDQLEWMHLCRISYLFRKTRLCREAILVDAQPTVLGFLGL